MNFDVAIIGGGPAGMTAGMYLARGGTKVVIIERYSLGGQAALTAEIENYPAVDKITGFELADLMKKQVVKFGVELVYDEVAAVVLEGTQKVIKTAYSGDITASALIINTGAKAKLLGIDREEELVGRGISYCATCDGAFYRDKVTMVVGGGNTAVEDAIYLAQFAKKVYIVHRRDQFRAEAIIVEKMYANPKIEVIINSTISLINGENKLEDVTIEDKNTKSQRKIELDGLFVAVGVIPNSSIFINKLETNSNGHIVVSKNKSTSIAGVFAGGDVTDTALRQVITACGDGAICADSAFKYLNEK